MSILPSLFTDDEKEVGEILLDLPDLIFESEVRNNLPYKWGATKKRSVPSARKLKRYNKKRKREEEVVTSPSTPLANFSPSESDEKARTTEKVISFLFDLFFADSVCVCVRVFF